MLDIHGDIIVGDEGFSEEFMARIQEIQAAGVTRVLVMLEARHMTSTAFGAVITGWQQMQAQGGRLAVHSPSPSLRAVFKILRHVGIFFDTEAEALAHLEAPPA